MVEHGAEAGMRIVARDFTGQFVRYSQAIAQLPDVLREQVHDKDFKPLPWQMQALTEQVAALAAQVGARGAGHGACWRIGTAAIVAAMRAFRMRQHGVARVPRSPLHCVKRRRPSEPANGRRCGRPPRGAGGASGCRSVR